MFNRRRHRGVTLTDVIACSLIVPAVLGTLIPAMATRNREGGLRVKCSSNLRQLGLAIQMYANENKGNFPRTFFNRQSGTVLNTNQGWDSADSFSKETDGPSPVGDNNVPASIFLLMKTQDITSEVFICPSSPGERDAFNGNSQGAQGQSNFSDVGKNLSYSYIVPFPTQAALNAGFKLNVTLTSDFAIMADLNPGGPALLTTAHNAPRQQMVQVNSNNHDGDGENVLYADGHVEFQNSPFCGKQRKDGTLDNIYVAGGADSGVVAAVEAPPADDRDTILLPVDVAGPGQHHVASMSMLGGGSAAWLFAAGAVMVTVITLIVVMVKRASIPMAQTAAPMPPTPPAA